jgi:hypothetical protein
VLPEETGALHGVGLDQHRRDHRGEAVGGRPLHGQVEQAQLQHRADAGEEVEPRPGHLGAPVGVDGAEHLPQFQVVARGEVELARRADLLDHHEVVDAAHRRLALHQVRHGTQQRGEFAGERLGLGLGGLDVGGQTLGPGQQRLTLVRRRAGDGLADTLLLGAQRLETRQGGAVPRVQVQQPVDDGVVFATGTLRRAQTVRVIP